MNLDIHTSIVANSSVKLLGICVCVCVFSCVSSILFFLLLGNEQWIDLIDIIFFCILKKLIQVLEQKVL